jgi:competence protein ComEC
MTVVPRCLLVMLSLAAALAVVTLGGSARDSLAAQAGADGTVAKIVFVDVGQGDGVVMKIGSKIIVSDAGEFELENVNSALKALGAKRIDVAILSHPHEDHVKNFIGLFAQWQVKKAVMSRSAHWQGTKTNRAVMDAIKGEGLKPTYVTAGQKFTWGGASWQILNPPQGKFTGGSGEAAKASVAYLLRVNGVEVLFTGDIEEQVSADIAARLAPKLDGRVEVFLVTHHGSKYASPKDLLDLTHPRFAVLSVGQNGYGHPTAEAISRLRAVPSTIWCTDVNGSTRASISSSGKLTWSASDQKAPWWSSAAQKPTGSCVGRSANQPPPPTPPPPTTPPPTTPTPPPSPQCDPHYSGACVPPFPPDLNCADLRALGLALPVRVVVIGQDPHELDRDLDGLGCE